MNSIIFAISKHDTLRPPRIQFRPFANSTCDSKYHTKWCSATTHLMRGIGWSTTLSNERTPIIHIDSRSLQLSYLLQYRRPVDSTLYIRVHPSPYLSILLVWIIVYSYIDYQVQTATQIIPISEGGTNSQSMHYLVPNQSYGGLKLLPSDLKIMNTSSSNIDFKKISACL